LFARFHGFRGVVPSGFEASFYGVLVRDWLFTGTSKHLQGGLVFVGHPPLNGEYFEWIGLMSAIVSARSHFTMVELGAGWGRWLVAAARLAQQRNLGFTLAGVEADPDHFRWMQTVFADNGLDPGQHRLTCAAVAPKTRKALFLRHERPESNYGQHLIEPADVRYWNSQPGYQVVETGSQSLENLLAPFAQVDFLSFDVLGSEFEILRAATPQALQKVRVLQVSTNSAETDAALSDFFQRLGWLEGFRYSPQAEAVTPYGVVQFTEGLETWVNPRATEVEKLLKQSGAIYPMTGVPHGRPTGGGGVSVFDTDAAHAINESRMAHLESLQLPLAHRRVLDVGCGVGHLAQFFVAKGCEVICIDAREENIASLRTRYPGLGARVLNVETDSLLPLGRFDIVFSFGLLYHLENPIAALRNMAAVCDDLLLLETVILDHPEPLVRIVDEPTETVSQAVSGVAVRPTPAFVSMALSRAGLPFVYAPLTPPKHPDFEFQWKADREFFRDGHLLRCIFVGSRRLLDNAELVLQFHGEVSDIPETEPLFAPPAVLLPRAAELVQFRKIGPYPGWRFDIDWDREEADLRERREIWENCRSSAKAHPLEVIWYRGIRLVLYLGNDLSKQLFITGSFEPNEFAFLDRVLAPGMRFLDAGANEGLYSLFAAACVGETGRVYAFEPSSRELARILHNRALNRFPQLQIFPFALSDRSGFASFSIVAAEHSGQNTLGLLPEGLDLSESVEVPTRRLDDVAEAEGWDRLDFLKIDVEGGEELLIEGATRILRSFRPLLLFECSTPALERNGSSKERVLARLRSLDYLIYAFDQSTGLPRLAHEGEYSENMVAAPRETPLDEHELTDTRL
jgi:FkbM family methyltransferase